MNRFDQHREYPAACLYAVGLSAYVSRTLLLSLSTVADAKISNPPWVNFQPAGWVSFQSAPTIFNNNAFLNGQYKVGWYYDSSNSQKIGSTEKSSNRTGAYVLMDQAIWRDEQDPERVLRLFGQAATSNAATSPMRRWYSVGLVKQKPFASRPHDSIALGYGRAVLNSRTRDVQEAAATSFGEYEMIANLDNGEQMIELNYGAQVTPWLLLRPDLQYYIEPGAFSGKKRGNALAVGLQIKATF